MPNSHAEPANLPCRGCGRAFEAEVWVIVDTEERPDLLARLRAGTLHDLTCPHCGHTATLHAAVLLLRPHGAPALLFSPRRGGDREGDEEQAAALVGILRQHMGVAWRDEWLGDGITGVAREALPAALSDDAATAARLEAAAAVGGEVPPAVREALESVIAALTAEGVRVVTPDDLRRALEQRPALAAKVAAALGKEK